jgi:hypothetical protein
MTDARSSPGSIELLALAGRIEQRDKDIRGAGTTIQRLHKSEVALAVSAIRAVAQSDHEGPARVERVETTGQLPPVPSPSSVDELKMLIMEYNPMTPDWNFRRTVIMEVLSRIPDVAQAAPEPAITDAMVEAGARVAATRRGHKDCDHLVATVNAGRVPVWEFYTEEPRAILEAALALSSTDRGSDV